MSVHRVAAKPISVVVADHDVLACRLLASRLRKHSQFQVTECTESAVATVDLLRRVHPSVAVISTNLRDAPKGGLQVLREIQAWSPRVRSILLLDGSDQHSVVEAFHGGARGVFMRSAYQFETLCKCVHRVHQGQIWADSKQLGYVLDAFAQSPLGQTPMVNGLNLVSKREQEVVRLVVEGLSNREIAQRLNLSEHTIKNYVFRIFDKLGVSNRVELVHLALANGERSLSSENDRAFTLTRKVAGM